MDSQILKKFFISSVPQNFPLSRALVENTATLQNYGIKNAKIALHLYLGLHSLSNSYPLANYN